MYTAWVKYMADIINNRLRWDGSHLGQYNNIISMKWFLERNTYYEIIMPDGWSDDIPGGIIYCIGTKTKNIFPCIVEDIKVLFDIPRRGIHRITINNSEYNIYYVPMTVDNEILWETPLNRLDNKHPLRKDPLFKRRMQKIIAFCDILGLSSTTESSVCIRRGVNDELIPFNINETSTSLVKEHVYDYSIVSKTLFTKWFGEETSINDIVRDMLNYKNQQSTIPEIKTATSDNLGKICADIRTNVEKIVKRYTDEYVWYSYFVMDRTSRHLLCEI